MIKMTQGPARELLPQNVVSAMTIKGALIVDERRLRSSFFDGRFLTARDLTREQTYFLTRQADVCRAGGVGVVTGLGVTNVDGKTKLSIAAGHGVTPSGELCVIPADFGVDVAQVPQIEQLDAAFGLSSYPRVSARGATGLFVLALRPVEYTANPIAQYPTTLGGQRTVEDGDIVEAVAITLVPYSDQTSGLDLDARRGRAAQEIFTSGIVRGVPADALPLAMIALDNGLIHWVDVYMVRREIGAEPLDVLGLGQGRRALREAHLLQYAGHLADVLAQRAAASTGSRFAASQIFSVLPPAGQLPAATIDATAFTQVYFPPEIDVDIAVIPDDELAPLVEESLMLPPIDLTASSAALSSTAVLILVPLPRDAVQRASAAIPVHSGGKLALAAPNVPSTPAIVTAVGGGSTAASSGTTGPSGVVLLGTSVAGTAAVDAAWQSVLTQIDPLWYVRRRNLPYKADVVGQGADAPVINVNPEVKLLTWLASIGVDADYTAQIKAHVDPTYPAALNEALLLLSEPGFDRPLILGGAVEALVQQITAGGGQLTHAIVINVAVGFANPNVGAGLIALEGALGLGSLLGAPPSATAKPLVTAIVQSEKAAAGSVLALDTLMASFDVASVASVAAVLKALGAAPVPASVVNLIGSLKALGPSPATASIAAFLGTLLVLGASLAAGLAALTAAPKAADITSFVNGVKALGATPTAAAIAAFVAGFKVSA